MKCRYCMVKGSHDILCPRGVKEKREWFQGYQDGSNSDPMMTDAVIYKMGYKVGRTERGQHRDAAQM